MKRERVLIDEKPNQGVRERKMFGIHWSRQSAHRDPDEPQIRYRARACALRFHSGVRSTVW
jgi:hypothetical protein